MCDEPVSAFDVSVQNKILNLLRNLQEERRLTYVFISHDLGVVRYIADRVCVMFLGRVCELGSTEAIFDVPADPYTRFLLDSVPSIDPHHRRERTHVLEGKPPSPVSPPSGCCFRTRCPYATEECAQEAPKLRSVDGRLVACHRCR